MQPQHHGNVLNIEQRHRPFVPTLFPSIIMFSQEWTDHFLRFREKLSTVLCEGIYPEPASSQCEFRFKRPLPPLFVFIVGSKDCSICLDSSEKIDYKKSKTSRVCDLVARTFDPKPLQHSHPIHLFV